MSKKPIFTEKAPQAIASYSQAILLPESRLLFCSGQIAIDPATGKMVSGGIVAETNQVMKNLQAVLAAAGSSLKQVVKTTVYITSMDDFASMNKTYQSFFEGDLPARATVQATGLPLGATVEIEAIALVE